ncbi:F0F1 ATP synthase subunit epsilon [Jiella pacifica]|uniref:F0F1 ATP synthase subunit epsilon n=1 Tax=Jiella pacifica TaxID=2696469 RepID=A0A6N9T6T8_9HYPH|nr:F0F1 ATP synthase subunit epsilon [Jiella pacifica]NDW07114.1 F0F1 ATP synthase subunit epsilon [Jiella pacifica]
MRLQIVSPLVVVVDEDEVAAIRAEDESGGFGILAGHADFLTTLAISVVSWTAKGRPRRHCAVRGGVLTVSGGGEVRVATREAVVGDDLTKLHDTVLRQFEANRETERTEHVETTRLQLAAVRQIVRHLRPGPATISRRRS